MRAYEGIGWFSVLLEVVGAGLLLAAAPLVGRVRTPVLPQLRAGGTTVTPYDRALVVGGLVAAGLLAAGAFSLVRRDVSG